MLAPALESEVAHPPGMDPATQAKLKTGEMQTAGGGQAAAVGQGGLLAARTRNSGGPAAAIASAARGSGQQLSQAELQSDLANEKLKEGERQEGLGGLGSLESGTQNQSLSALGDVAPLVNANTSAVNASYDPFTDILNPILGAASNAAKFKV